MKNKLTNSFLSINDIVKLDDNMCPACDGKIINLKCDGGGTENFGCPKCGNRYYFGIHWGKSGVDESIITKTVEKTIDSVRAFNGKLLKLDVLGVELPSGKKSVREIVRHPGAVAVWAVTPDGRFVFVNQYRKAAEQETLEIVAGTKDKIESAEDCAIREISEETGYDVEHIAHIGTIFSSPGYSDEKIDIFYAKLMTSKNSIKPDPDEIINTVFMWRHEFETLVKECKIKDSKTLAAWAMVLLMGVLNDEQKILE